MSPQKKDKEKPTIEGPLVDIENNKFKLNAVEYFANGKEKVRSKSVS